MSQAGDAFSASNMNDLEDRIDEAFKEVNANLPFAFGVDANGNYGYIKEGADTVTPFSADIVVKVPWSKGIYHYNPSASVNVTNYIPNGKTIANCDIYAIVSGTFMQEGGDSTDSGTMTYSISKNVPNKTITVTIRPVSGIACGFLFSNLVLVFH